MSDTTNQAKQSEVPSEDSKSKQVALQPPYLTTEEFQHFSKLRNELNMHTIEYGNVSRQLQQAKRTVKQLKQMLIDREKGLEAMEIELKKFSQQYFEPRKPAQASNVKVEETPDEQGRYYIEYY